MKLPRTVTCLIPGLIALTVFQPLTFGAFPPGITGTWRGTFNGQPLELKPNGSYPEIVTPFELRLAVKAGKLTGTLVIVDRKARKIRIKNSQCDQDGCSFEVMDNADCEVMAWRVERVETRLEGNRNSGPLTPLGIGAGARLFRITARRIVRHRL